MPDPSSENEEGPWIESRREGRIRRRRENASKRREERVKIISHRKWIFISLAVIAVVILLFKGLLSKGGFFF